MNNNDIVKIYTDFIDDDGYVQRYNYDKEIYYNTGICLKGAKGNSGRPGKNGDSWDLKEIDGTYYWFKNGVNTRIAAAVADYAEKKTDIVAPVNTTDATLPITTLTCEVGKYYRIDVAVDTFAVTLPAVTDTTRISNIVFMLTTGTTPAVTFTAPSGINVYYQDGFEIEASSTYEINALFNGAAWIVASVKINVE